MSRAALSAHCENCGATTDDGEVYVVSRVTPVLGLDREGSIVLGYEHRLDSNRQIIVCVTCSAVVTLISDDGGE